jgi:hypothetical protein
MPGGKDRYSVAVASHGPIMGMPARHNIDTVSQRLLANFFIVSKSEKRLLNGLRLVVAHSVKLHILSAFSKYVIRDYFKFEI